MNIKLIDYGLDKGFIPKRAHHNDAGADVYLKFDVSLAPHETKKVPLGFGIEIPNGMTGFLMPRSSLASGGIVINYTPIDSGYRGELYAVVHNQSALHTKIPKGSRIGQLVIIPVILADFTLDDDKERGTGGFGSTGK